MKVSRFYEKQTEFTLIRPHNINSSLPASCHLIHCAAPKYALTPAVHYTCLQNTSTPENQE